MKMLARWAFAALPLCLGAFGCQTADLLFPSGAGGSGGGPSGGAGGPNPAGGSGAGGAEPGGAGGELPDLSLAPVITGEVIHSSGTEILSLAADETHLYWVEYGHKDDGDVSVGDGRLVRRPLAGGAAEAVLTNLEGPSLVKLTPTDAFVTLEESTAIRTQGQQELWRYSLTDDQAEPALVQANPGALAKFSYVRGDTYWIAFQWDKWDSGRLSRLLKTGQVELLTTAAFGFAVAQPNIYWSVGRQGYVIDDSLIGVFMAPLDDLSASHKVSDLQSDFVMIDGAFVSIQSGDSDEVLLWAEPLDGSEGSVFAEGSAAGGKPLQLALEAERIRLFRENEHVILSLGGAPIARVTDAQPLSSAVLLVQDLVFYTDGRKIYQASYGPSGN